jgi:hypothetical protein
MESVDHLKEFDTSGTENRMPRPLNPHAEADRPVRFIAEHSSPIWSVERELCSVAILSRQTSCFTLLDWESQILNFRRVFMIVRCLFVVGLLSFSAFAAEDKEKPLTPIEARKQVGKEISVEMEVKSAKNALEKRGEIYLDSEENFRDEKNFAVVITKKGAESLKAANIDNPADHFRGKTIRAKGKVTEVAGVPRIEIDDAKQIQIP